MSVDAYIVTKNCNSCEHDRFEIRKHATVLNLFPATKPSTNVDIDILGQLMDSNNGNYALPVITDRFWKLSETAPLLATAAQDTAMAITQNWGLFVQPTEQASRRQHEAAYFPSFYRRRSHTWHNKPLYDHVLSTNE